MVLVFYSVVLFPSPPGIRGDTSVVWLGPLAVGLAWMVAADAGGGGTGGLAPGGHGSGAAMNPARVLGASVIFGCGWTLPFNTGGAWVFVLAEYLGAVIAAVLHQWIIAPHLMARNRLRTSGSPASAVRGGEAATVPGGEGGGRGAVGIRAELGREEAEGHAEEGRGAGGGVCV